MLLLLLLLTAGSLGCSFADIQRRVLAAGHDKEADVLVCVAIIPTHLLLPLVTLQAAVLRCRGKKGNWLKNIHVRVHTDKFLIAVINY